MKPSVVVWLALVGLNLVGRADAEQVVSDAKIGFSFTLPEGFEGNPTRGTGDKLSLTFLRGQPDEPSFAILQVVSMGGTIGRGKLDHAIVERAAHDSVRAGGATITRFDYRQTTWKTFDLELLVAWVSKGNQRLITLTTQVPLAREAIHLNLAGPVADEPKLVADLQSVLGSLTGKSNWLTDRERSERLGRTVGFVFVVALVPVVILLMLRRRQRRATPN